MKILVSNIMMLKERDRFEKALVSHSLEPIFADVAQALTEEECLRYAGKIDGWLAGDDAITQAVLEACRPRLQVIAKWGTGLDSIDLEAANQLGVPVLNSPGAFADAVAEVAIHYMLSLSRQLVAVDRDVRRGAWPKPMGLELKHSTLGLIGFGAIGRRIGELASAFGMRVVFYDPAVHEPVTLNGQMAEPIALEKMPARADFICLACNYTPESRHLINESFLLAMKPRSFVVNVARGALVDDRALARQLALGHIAGAGLDVFEQEPIPSDHPFLSMDNVILGSHNANNARGAVEAVHECTMRNLIENIR